MSRLQSVEEYVTPVDTINPLRVESYTEKDEIVEVLRSYAVKNRIACGRLRKIAKELGLPSNKLGALAKEYNIKIVACELGCF
ncbi:hypothetical protein [Desulfuribacillus alkaliarsenatis]|uniref:hypothetical protein n=1 Tax=Desulfuribacillus alkaliarsenatis TaxID=766136 RepID=UPI000A0409A4|nr:hypothetical protein [Desulfuribacillus alkaliarsenatis]